MIHITWTDFSNFNGGWTVSVGEGYVGGGGAGGDDDGHGNNCSISKRMLVMIKLSCAGHPRSHQLHLSRTIQCDMKISYWKST